MKAWLPGSWTRTPKPSMPRISTSRAHRLAPPEIFTPALADPPSPGRRSSMSTRSRCTSAVGPLARTPARSTPWIRTSVSHSPPE